MHSAGNSDQPGSEKGHYRVPQEVGSKGKARDSETSAWRWGQNAQGRDHLNRNAGNLILGLFC